MGKLQKQEALCCHILLKMNELRLAGAYCDTVLLVSGHTLPVHRLVLAATSKYFKNVFDTNPESAAFELNWVAVGDVVQLLDFIYTGQLALKPASCARFRDIAEQLEMSILKEMCDAVSPVVVLEKPKISPNSESKSLDDNGVQSEDSLQTSASPQKSNSMPLKKKMKRERTDNHSEDEEDSSIAHDVSQSAEAEATEAMATDDTMEGDVSSHQTCVLVDPTLVSNALIADDIESEVISAEVISAHPGPAASQHGESELTDTISTHPGEVTTKEGIAPGEPVNLSDHHDEASTCTKPSEILDLLDIHDEHHTPSDGWVVLHVSSQPAETQTLASLSYDTIHELQNVDGLAEFSKVSSEHLLDTSTCSIDLDPGDSKLGIGDLDNQDLDTSNLLVATGDDGHETVVSGSTVEEISLDCVQTYIVNLESPQNASRKVSLDGDFILKVQGEDPKKDADPDGFRCETCDIPYTRRDDFMKHLKRKHPDQMHVCLFCGRLFAWHSDHQRHQERCGIANNKVDGRYKCTAENCDFDSAKLNITLDHFRKQHTTCFQRACSKCGTAFNDDKKYMEHMLQSHGINASGLGKHKLYECDQCKFKTFIFYLYQKHQASHDMTGTAPVCAICQKLFVSNTVLQKHVKQVHTDQVHPCSYCDDTFRSQQTLRSHEYRTHGLVATKTRKVLQCSHCSYSHISMSEIRRHERNRHSNIRPYVCAFCSKAFKAKASLMMHESTHTGDKPYRCDLCDYCATSKSNLVSHQRIRHSDDKPYVCELCGYRTSVLANLRKHQPKCESRQSLLHSDTEPIETSMDTMVTEGDAFTILDVPLQLLPLPLSQQTF